MEENKVSGAHKCPVCGKYEFSARGSYETCPWCGWGDDSWDDTDDEFSGFNGCSIGEYREKYKRRETETDGLVKYRKMMEEDGEL